MSAMHNGVRLRTSCLCKNLILKKFIHFQSKVVIPQQLSAFMPKEENGQDYTNFWHKIVTSKCIFTLFLLVNHIHW